MKMRALPLPPPPRSRNRRRKRRCRRMAARPAPASPRPRRRPRRRRLRPPPHRRRRLSPRPIPATGSRRNVPHIYLTVDIRLDALLKLRSELNAGLESRGVKLSVNDMLIKALAVALIQVPECNVQYTGNELVTFKRADISVAVSIPN